MMTPLGVAILSMLAERPMHCYEMYRLMLRRHEDRIVKVKPGSLYHTMDRLVDHELAEVAGTDRDGGRPERTTYRITPAGRTAMATWVRGTIAEPVNEFPRLPVALAEMHHLPHDEVVALLNERIGALRQLLDTDLGDVGEAERHAVPEFYLLDAHYLMDMTRAELQWLERTVVRLKHKELEWPSTSRP